MTTVDSAVLESVAASNRYDVQGTALHTFVEMIPAIAGITEAILNGRIVGPHASREAVNQLMPDIVKLHIAAQHILVGSDPEDDDGGGCVVEYDSCPLKAA